MLKFTATECGSSTEDGSISCGASNSQDEGADQHYVILSRWLEANHPDDWGPQFELDDQSHALYTPHKRVSFAGDLMVVEIDPPPKQVLPYTTIEVDLSRCPKEQIDALKAGLRIVFRDAPEKLQGA